MKEPSVTVLVTVRNSQKTIEKCIRSLFKLNYKNYKIFVTDAYSTDGTWEILTKLKKKYSKKFLLEQVKGDIAKAHNYMIKKVKTKYVAMTDADCEVHKNWLKALILSFTSEDIIAATGYCSTPKNAVGLQKLIGMELEERFKHAPKYVLRGPTMNLAVRTIYAKKVKFDERFDVAQETDWGYRLTKLGKMIFVPKAIVYHHHRSTWMSFLKQHAFRYGRATPLLYLKHFRKAKGDHITRRIILAQEYVFWLACLFSLLCVFAVTFIWSPFLGFTLSLALALWGFLFLLYFLDIRSFTKKRSDIVTLFPLWLLRNIVYTLGMIVGIFDLIKKT